MPHDRGRSPQSSLQPLVIINGVGAPRMASRLYGTFFRRHGYRVYTVPQSVLNFGDIRKSAQQVHQVVLRAAAASNGQRVSLLGLSLGGLIGLYYLRCAQGGEHVDRFVSIGGPLRGSPLAKVSHAPLLDRLVAVRQTIPDGELIREVLQAANPPGVRMFALGTRGDTITPRGTWDAAGLQNVETVHGRFPFGHWYLYAHPGNQRAVLELLQCA